MNLHVTLGSAQFFPESLKNNGYILFISVFSGAFHGERVIQQESIRIFMNKIRKLNKIMNKVLDANNRTEKPFLKGGKSNRLSCLFKYNK